MGSNRRKWLSSALALTGVSSFALVSGQAQGTARIVRGGANTLTLQLRGVAPAAVEVEIGGIVVAHRQLSGRTDSLQIPLSSAGLPPGFHEATVRLYDARGRLLSTLRGQIELLPDPSAPISIIIPRHGTSVSGTVPIEVRVNGQSRPYVSFFVDGQVRTLRNYAPYVYHWDTTRERNGWHTLEAWSFDGSQTFKSPPTRVLVNNPGGRTDRPLPAQSDEQVGLNEPTLATPTSVTARTGATMRTPERIEGQMDSASRLSRPPAPLGETREPAPRMTPSAPSAPQEAHRAVAPISAPAVSYRIAQAEARSSRANRLSPPPIEPAPPVETQMASMPTLGESHLRPTDVAPRMRGQRLATPQIALVPSAPAHAPRPPAKATWLPLTFGTRLPANITRYEVLLDARPVRFDVAPRVQDGIPLVTIRQVFEQAGGRLSWDNQRKVATVELAGRTLTLDVRANRALLDGEALPVEVPLQVVNGRVMAPASLLGKALNAQLAFDLDTHQLHINTQ